MKTTVEIADSLFARAKECSLKMGVPFRQLVEEGLRTVIERQQQGSGTFRLRDGSFDGQGPSEDLSWHDLRSRVYEGRGG
jgi:hypothetical protein